MAEQNMNREGAATPPVPEETPAQAAQHTAQQPPQEGYQYMPPQGAYQQVPPQQPPYGQAGPPPARPLMHLTGGMKFGWFVVGALLGIGGIVVAWLVNVDKVPQVKSEALKFSIIGFVVWIVLGLILCLVFGGMVMAAMAGMGGYYGGHYLY